MSSIEIWKTIIRAWSKTFTEDELGKIDDIASDDAKEETSRSSGYATNPLDDLAEEDLDEY